LHILENLPTGLPWTSVCNDSDDFLLQYKHLFGAQGVAPKNYTIGHDGMNVSEIGMENRRKVTEKHIAQFERLLFCSHFTTRFIQPDM
jgi:hypothetical protein